MEFSATNVNNMQALDGNKLTSGRSWAPPPRPFPQETWKTSRKAEKQSNMLMLTLAAG